MRNFIFGLTGLIFLTTATSAFAADNKSVVLQKLIKAKNQKIEFLLNDKSTKQQAAAYLHEHISDKAVFTLSVLNPELAAGKQSFEMDKTGYINTYIQGTNFIDNYSVDIKTVNMQPTEDENKAYSMEIMTERGTMIDPVTAGRGKDFISQTTCRTLHSLENSEKVVAEGSECHTEVSYEENV